MRYLILITLLSTMAPAQLGPFEGFGAGATGGSKIVNVVNLNDSGAGSLRACIATTGNWCKFTVSGTITINSSLTLGVPNVTIDGFSAPPPGITIQGSGFTGECLHVWGSGLALNGHDVIIQGLRFRGTGCNNDDISVEYGAYNVVIDHVSTDNGQDGNIDITTDAHDVTVSWSILSNNASSGAMLVKYGAYHISLHHNLWYNNQGSGNTRIPWIEGVNEACCQSGSEIELGINADIRWNVYQGWIYGIVFAADNVTHLYGNVVGNLALNDGTGHAKNAINIGGMRFIGPMYLAGNASFNDPRNSGSQICPAQVGVADPLPICMANMNNLVSSQTATPYPTPPVTGPCTFDNTGRLTEWTRVITTSGVKTYFVDDLTDAATRAGVSIPSPTIFSSAWNAQTGSCRRGLVQLTSD